MCKIFVSVALGSSTLHLTQTSFTDEPVQPLLPELAISGVRYRPRALQHLGTQCHFSCSASHQQESSFAPQAGTTSALTLLFHFLTLLASLELTSSNLSLFKGKNTSLLRVQGNYVGMNWG